MLNPRMFVAARALRPVLLSIVLLAVAACGSAATGDSGSSGSGPTGPSTKPVASVLVTPSSLAIIVGQTGTLQAQPRDASGNALSGRTVTWASSNTAVATVSAGTVTAIAVGTAVITATSEGQSGSAAITVVPIPIATIVVAPRVVSLAVGQTSQLSAVALDAGGNTLSGRTATWTSSNAGVATVSATGLVTGVAPGTATISAAAEGHTGAAAVTVVRSTSYTYFKRGVSTPGTATLIEPGAAADTLHIDGHTIAGISIGSNDFGAPCFTGNGGGVFTSCASAASQPYVMRLCGDDGTGTVRLMYIVMAATDSNRVTATATDLLNALQSDTRYLGIGIYKDCNGTYSQMWARNYPQTNYFLWPDVFTTYSSAFVSAQLSGAAIYKTPTAGTDYHAFAVIRYTGGAFEVWK